MKVDDGQTFIIIFLHQFHTVCILTRDLGMISMDLYLFSVSTNRNFNLIFQQSLIWQCVTIVHFAELISYDFVQSHLGLHAYCFSKKILCFHMNRIIIKSPPHKIGYTHCLTWLSLRIFLCFTPTKKWLKVPFRTCFVFSGSLLIFKMSWLYNAKT